MGKADKRILDQRDLEMIHLLRTGWSGIRVEGNVRLIIKIIIKIILTCKAASLILIPHESKFLSKQDKQFFSSSRAFPGIFLLNSSSS